MPFVVERISVRAHGALRELARRSAHVEALDHDRVPLAADDGLVAELGPERARLVDLAAAENALVPGGERLRDRRRRPDDVDHDPDRRRRRSRTA